MRRLIKRANSIGEEGEVPVAAVILNAKGHCIGYGINRRERYSDPLGHAELIALKQAAWIRGDWRFNDCTLIVNLEPCPMCAGALTQARMGAVVYGASDLKRGGLGGSLDLSTHPSAHHKMKVRGGVYSLETSKQLKYWFEIKRGK
tara:strand:- start:100 stop:537 length:438 start_codon:yes stop_codon:yes gene_type:complete